jgi:hypothetical protein
MPPWIQVQKSYNIIKVIKVSKLVFRAEDGAESSSETVAIYLQNFRLQSLRTSQHVVQ